MTALPEQSIPQFKSKNLTCVECHNPFIFSASEQTFFYRRSLTNEPKRCSNCRVLKRLQREGQSSIAAHQAKCAQCGNTTVVPFEPNGHKLIYCLACMAEKKMLKATKNEI